MGRRKPGEPPAAAKVYSVGYSFEVVGILSRAAAEMLEIARRTGNPGVERMAAALGRARVAYAQGLKRAANDGEVP